jgi:hypothetical protein
MTSGTPSDASGKLQKQRVVSGGSTEYLFTPTEDLPRFEDYEIQLSVVVTSGNTSNAIPLIGTAAPRSSKYDDKIRAVLVVKQDDKWGLVTGTVQTTDKNIAEAICRIVRSTTGLHAKNLIGDFAPVPIASRDGRKMIALPIIVSVAEEHWLPARRIVEQLRRVLHGFRLVVTEKELDDMSFEHPDDKEMARKTLAWHQSAPKTLSQRPPRRCVYPAHATFKVFEDAGRTAKSTISRSNDKVLQPRVIPHLKPPVGHARPSAESIWARNMEQHEEASRASVVHWDILDDD